MDTITREEARALGRRRFYTGRACKKGHDAERLVSNYACVACQTAACWRAPVGMRVLRLYPHVPADWTDAQCVALEKYLIEQCLPVYIAAVVKSGP